MGKKRSGCAGGNIAKAINAHLTKKFVKYSVYFHDQHVKLPCGNHNAIGDSDSDVI